jgi:hypothetical protein
VGGEYDVDKLRDKEILEIYLVWRGSWKIIAEGWTAAQKL